jgi:hypothetical protein
LVRLPFFEVAIRFRRLLISAAWPLVPVWERGCEERRRLCRS